MWLIWSPRFLARLRGLGDPLPGRMSGHPEDVNSEGPDFDHEQCVQAAQEDRIEVEEVAGQQAVGLGARKARQDVSASRGAGPCPWVHRTRRTVDSLSR
jgi:hypothetical protein